jgi:hypothetical protein
MTTQADGQSIRHGGPPAAASLGYTPFQDAARARFARAGLREDGEQDG